MQDYMQIVPATKPPFNFSHHNSSSQIWLSKKTRRYFSGASDQSREAGEDNGVEGFLNLKEEVNQQSILLVHAPRDLNVHKKDILYSD